jgi:hypothetical protein
LIFIGRHRSCDESVANRPFWTCHADALAFAHAHHDAADSARIARFHGARSHDHADADCDLAAVAAPAMRLRAQQQDEHSARQLDADMVLARREAIKRNTRVLICPRAPPPASARRDDDRVDARMARLLRRGLRQRLRRHRDTNPNPIRQHGALEATLT